MTNQRHPNRFEGMVGAGLSVIVAYVPVFVVYHILRNLLTDGITDESAVVIFVVLTVSLILAAFLLRLAYRMATGKSRSKDGGLVSPIILLVFSFILAAGSFLLVTLAIKNRDVRAAVGAISFLGLASGGASLAWKRLRA